MRPRCHVCTIAAAQTTARATARATTARVCACPTGAATIAPRPLAPTSAPARALASTSSAIAMPVGAAPTARTALAPPAARATASVSTRRATAKPGSRASIAPCRRVPTIVRVTGVVMIGLVSATRLTLAPIAPCSRALGAVVSTSTATMARAHACPGGLDARATSRRTLTPRPPRIRCCDAAATRRGQCVGRARSLPPTRTPIHTHAHSPRPPAPARARPRPLQAVCDPTLRVGRAQLPCRLFQPRPLPRRPVQLHRWLVGQSMREEGLPQRLLGSRQV